MTLTITFSSAPSARDQEASVVLVRDDAASAWTRYGPEVITYSGTTATVTIPDRSGCQVQVRCGRLASPIITASSPAPYSLTLGSVDIWSSETATQFNFPNGDAPTDARNAVVKISEDGGATVSSTINIVFSADLVTSTWAMYDEDEGSCPLYTAMAAARAAGHYVAIEMTTPSAISPVTVKSSWTNTINAI